MEYYELNKQIQKKEDKRERILEVALELFVKKGYHQTKITDIASEMGMSVGLLFHYFKSKEVLYETIIEIGLNNFETVFSWEENEPLKSFETMASKLLNAHKEKILSASVFVFIEQGRRQKFESKKILNLFKKYNVIKISIPFIEKGQHLGEIKNGNPQALSILFWKALEGILVELVFYPKAPCPEKEWIMAILKK